MRGVERWTKWLVACEPGGARQRAARAFRAMRRCRSTIRTSNSTAAFCKLNQVVLDPPPTVVKSVSPGPVLNRAARSGREPEGAACFRQRHPAGPLQRRRHHVWPVHHQLDLRPRRIVRRRDARRPAAADRRFRPDPVRLGRPGGPFVERPISVPRPQRDAVGGIVDTAGDPVGWAGGTLFGWRWTVGTGGLGAVVHLGPVETGREFVGRLLQLLALELLSDAPGAIA